MFIEALSIEYLKVQLDQNSHYWFNLNLKHDRLERESSMEKLLILCLRRNAHVILLCEIRLESRLNII